MIFPEDLWVWFIYFMITLTTNIFPNQQLNCVSMCYVFCIMYFVSIFNNGDKVTQLFSCWIRNQQVAGSIPGVGTLVCPRARQFIPYYLSLPSCKMGTQHYIRQCLELAQYMLPAALEYPSWIEMVSVCTGQLGIEGRSCEHFGEYTRL